MFAVNLIVKDINLLIKDINSTNNIKRNITLRMLLRKNSLYNNTLYNRKPMIKLLNHTPKLNNKLLLTSLVTTLLPRIKPK